jgi:hypothetical protein
LLAHRLDDDFGIIQRQQAMGLIAMPEEPPDKAVPTINATTGCPAMRAVA